MATGHILPGYGDPVSRLRRVRSVGYPLDKKTLSALQQQARLDQNEFESIRNNARQLWSYSQNHETSYNNHFAERVADELMQSRPTSPTRRNKPHPQMVFLTNRLHYIPGYHNADTTVGKEVYRVDASMPPEERMKRESVRKKYTSRNDAAMTIPYKDPHGIRQQFDGRTAQAAEAWLKLADDSDKDNVLQVLQREKENQEFADQKTDHHQARAKTAYPSLHRWMRYAGANENDSVSRIIHAMETDPDRYGSPNPYNNTLRGQTINSMRMRDISSAGRFRFQQKPSRGDFMIHPDWPSTLPHHKIP